MSNSGMLIKWVGDQIISDKDLVKSGDYYKSVVFGDSCVSVGDHVLILQENSAYPGTEFGCDVAKILYLYEAIDAKYEDKCRAIVQWYSRPQAIPSYLHTDDIVMDFEKEVVQDFRPFDSNVSIETFFMKCLVIYGDIKELPVDIIQKSDHSDDIAYACRYALRPPDKKIRFILTPILELINKTNERSTSSRSCTANYKSGMYKELVETKKRTPRSAKKPLKNNDVSESPRTPRTRRNLDYLSTPKSSKLKGDEANKCTIINPLDNEDIENSAEENWGIKRKSNSKFMTDITNSVGKEKYNISPEIPIVSPIKLVKLPDGIKNKNSNKTLNRADIFAELNSDDEDEDDYLEFAHINRKTMKSVLARRNLTDSLNCDTSSNDEDCIGTIPEVQYSVILDKNKPNKIKLRVSDELKKNKIKEDLSDSSVNSSASSNNKHAKESLDLNYIMKSPIVRLKKINLNSDNSSDYISSPIIRLQKTKLKTKLEKNGHCIEETPTKRTPRLRRTNSRYSKDFIVESSPTKRRIDTPRSTRSKSRSDSVTKTETPQKIELREKCVSKTPIKSRRLEELQETPKRRKQSEPKTPESTPGLRIKQFKMGKMTPTMQSRDLQTTPTKGLNLARERLHVSAVPKSLPCRESEFNDIFTFIKGKILDHSGGCMYISGVPGTGKTATVTEAIKCLQKLTKEKKLPKFDFIEVNGMRLTEPRQAYVQIYRQMEGKTVPWEQARMALDKKFTTSGKSKVSTVLLVDELDILCTRRQDVVYTILDWPSKANARLIVVTIANTMDLPERLLRAKVTSRLGLTRRTFAPYSHKQLMDIVMSRLSGIDSFNSDAVQLVARKVAAVSGDARRALDICRRATEIAEFTGNNSSKNSDDIVSMVHVNKALSEMISSAKVTAIQKCSVLEKIFMQAVAAEVARTGVEETTFGCVLPHVLSLCALEGLPAVPTGPALGICCRLGSRRLLITESGKSDLNMKVLLNVGSDDLHYALQQSY